MSSAQPGSAASQLTQPDTKLEPGTASETDRYQFENRYRTEMVYCGDGHYHILHCELRSSN